MENYSTSEKAQTDMVKRRDEAEILSYIKAHRYLLPKAEEKLFQVASHALIMYYITHKKREVQTMAEAYNKACRSNAVELLCILQRQKHAPLGCAEPRFKLLQEEFKLMREGNEQDILEYMSYFQPSLDAFNILVEMNKKNCIQAYLEKWDV